MRYHRLFHTSFALIVIGIMTIVFLAPRFSGATSSEPLIGVTFSTMYARQLGLEPRSAFRAITQELGLRQVRLPVYWSAIEHAQGAYDWEELDWIVRESERQHIKLTLAVGAKVPRWPECFIPDWAELMGPEHRAEVQAEFVERVVKRYQESDAVVRWQIENEPFFLFGECPVFNAKEIFAEVELVRTIDERPIQMTASGELSPWYEFAGQADILGVSLYRTTWNPLIGYVNYPIPSSFYRTRFALAEPFFDEVIISELQAEPWFSESIDARPLAQWLPLFTADDFRRNVAFAKETGADEIYLWGAEWWYLLRQHNHPELWDVASELFVL